MERLTVSVRKPVKDAIKKIAKAQDRPISEVTSKLIEDALVSKGIVVP